MWQLVGGGPIYQALSSYFAQNRKVYGGWVDGWWVVMVVGGSDGDG